MTSNLLRLFFSGIKISEDQTSVIRSLPEGSIIIYASKYKSRFDYWFYHNRYPQIKLPCPEIGMDYRSYAFQPLSRLLKNLLFLLDTFFSHGFFPNPYRTDFFKDSFVEGKAGFFSLIEKKGFYRRFIKQKNDPIRHLIEIQKGTDRTVYIIPQLIFFGKTPHRSIPTLLDILFGSEENPGRIRRLVTLFKNPGKIFVEVSDPISVKDFIAAHPPEADSSNSLPLILRRQIIDQFNRHRQSITGPVLKSREELKEEILTGRRLTEFLLHYAETRNLPLQKVRKEANACLDEIAANYNYVFVRIAAVCVRWIINSMFEGVTVNQGTLNAVKSLAKNGPIIVVPCHKSHIDYLILPYILYTNNMPSPHVVAGKNLSFWPMGPLFRSGGAFFIRRSFKGAVLYSKVFFEYVQKLLEEGFNIKIFIEGGRSRTGKLLIPKLGFLSILMTAYRNGACEDLIFSPIFIGYDRVLEESAYLNELEGGQKDPENFIQLIKARKFLKKRYGRIYIKFHEAISLKELLNKYQIDISTASQKELNTFVRNLGYRLTSAIDRVSVVTPHALTASAILNLQKKPFTLNQLRSQADTYLNYLMSQNVTIADSLLLDNQIAIKNSFDNYLQRRFIEPIPAPKDTSGTEPLFQVKEHRRPNLDYYKNNCVSFFIPASFTAISILEKDAFQFSASDLHSGYAFLQEFFKNEFASDMDRTPEYQVRKNIKAFIDDAILMPHPTLPDTYNLTSSGFRKLKDFAGFLKTYLEAYAVTLDFFGRYHHNGINPKDQLRKIQSRGLRMYKLNEIDNKESLSKIYYQNAVDFFLSQGIKSSDDQEKIEIHRSRIANYLKLL
ncbi:MAG: 1-acyl-sn-glycerol-3-phosphate acyltransferase [Thermodesulfobacteriota bacterium]